MEIKSVIEETNTQTNLHALCKYTDHANIFFKTTWNFMEILIRRKNLGGAVGARRLTVFQPKKQNGEFVVTHRPWSSICLFSSP